MTTPTIAIETAKVVADVLKTELGLANGAVMLANQKWNIPSDKGLHIVLSYVSPSKLISNVNTIEDTVGGANEVQEVAILDWIQIDAMSYDGSARSRLAEISMALASIYSRQQQDANNMQFGRMNSAFQDASMLEATGRLNRFVTTITVTALHRKIKAASYYDTFVDPEVKKDG